MQEQFETRKNAIPMISLEQFENILANDPESKIYPATKQVRNDNVSFMEYLSKTAEKLTPQEKAIFENF